jgi:acrylyl-CoA reductase (NADPH)
MIPGVDFAGVVSASTNPDFAVGDDVVATGCGLGEMHYGGYAQMARVHGEWLNKVPAGMTRADCMAIGTAGVTAMLSVMALEKHGLEPGDGPVLVTGATGGVGCVSIALLAKLGYSVVASTGKPENANVLKLLGATEVIARSELAGKPRPLSTERWAGAIDVVGSATLANVLSQTKYGGIVAACGLVQGIDLPTTVAPFILRGVTLAGIESVMMPHVKRTQAWERLAQDLDLARLHAMTETRPLKDVALLASLIVAGKVKGRVVFEVPQLAETAEVVEEVAVAEAAASVEAAEVADEVEAGATTEDVGNAEVVEAAESVDVAEEPAAEAPATETLATEEPASEAPIVEEPVAAEPAPEEPTAAELAAAEPAPEEPVVAEPTLEDPTVEEPVAENPTPEVPAIAEPASEEPAAKEPVSAEAATQAPAAEQPATDEAPASEEVATEKPAT